MKTTTAIHPFPPVYNEDSAILILGTFPSVKSRENAFYYGHKQNRFWKVLSSVMKDDCPRETEEKIRFLSKHRIALWDVIQTCEISGSSDSSIKNAVANDLEALLKETSISKIFCNGKKAYELYQKFFPDLSVPVKCLPSTSPANAMWSIERLIEEWSKIE